LFTCGDDSETRSRFDTHEQSVGGAQIKTVAQARGQYQAAALTEGYRIAILMIHSSMIPHFKKGPHP
jgi:hypothetical protein